MSDWFIEEEMSNGPIRRMRSISSTPVERTCAACASSVVIEVPIMNSKPIPENEWAGGVDGRPGYDPPELGFAVRALEEQDLYLETCPRCAHVAPHLDISFNDYEVARARRESFARLGVYGRTALRYIYVAALYGEEDPYWCGMWLLRAAWAAEAMGLSSQGADLRRFAAASFEESIAGGVAVATDRGGTSLVMTELHRVSGDFERAAEHCRRGLLAIFANAKLFLHTTRIFLLAEADRIVSRRQDVLLRQTVKDEFETLLKPRRTEIFAAIEAACPTPPAIRQVAWRSRFHRGLPLPFDRMVVFGREFLDVDRLIPHLRTSSTGVYEAMWARPHLLEPILLATDHEDAEVRDNALSALYGHDLPPTTIQSPDAIDALSRRLFDDDEMVCRAGPILLKVLGLAPAFRDRVMATAQTALDQRKHDLSAEGVLERFGARVR